MMNLNKAVVTLESVFVTNNFPTCKSWLLLRWLCCRPPRKPLFLRHSRQYEPWWNVL